MAVGTVFVVGVAAVVDGLGDGDGAVFFSIRR